MAACEPGSGPAVRPLLQRLSFPSTLAVAALLSGCVFPAWDTTGVELSWLFLEAPTTEDDTETDEDASDELDPSRVRTCAGFGVRRLEIAVTDESDPERSKVFAFSCAEGYQTPQQFQLAASDAFVPLRTGDYVIQAEVFAEASKPILQDTAMVPVGERGVMVQAWAFQPPPISWRLDLAGLETCEQASFALYYDDPRVQLAEFAEDAEAMEEPPPDVLYREQLVSDRGLSLAGEQQACDALEPGTHWFEHVDRGRYRLVITLDGAQCELPVRVDRVDAPATIDLAQLSCTG